MMRFKTLIPMLCLCLLASVFNVYATSFCVADGAPITLIKSAGNSSTDKTNYVSAYVNGHYLCISFTSNVGRVGITITDSSGTNLDCAFFETPTGFNYYIPIVGHYTLRLSFTNGDEYYGEFEIEE